MKAWASCWPTTDRPEAGELMIDWCAGVLDTGVAGHAESSMAKVAVSRCAVPGRRPLRAGDGRHRRRAIPIVEQVFREIRAFRIYDGPTEVHKWSLAKKIKRDGGTASFLTDIAKYAIVMRLSQ
jgi:acyl-CoA dehydrogenase